MLTRTTAVAAIAVVFFVLVTADLRERRLGEKAADRDGDAALHDIATAIAALDDIREPRIRGRVAFRLFTHSGGGSETILLLHGKLSRRVVDPRS